MCKVKLVTTISLLEGSLCKPVIVAYRFSRSCDSGFVDDCFCLALPRERTLHGLGAITGFLGLFRGIWFGGKNLRVVAAYDCMHVAHTAVADLDGVSVEHASQRVPFREMLVHQFKKLSGHVCSYILIVRGVKPDNIPLAFSLLFSLSVLWRAVSAGLILQIAGVPAFLQGLLVHGLCFIEGFLITGYRAESVFNGGRKVFNDCRRMV